MCGTRAETRFRLSAKRTCPFKSAGVSVQSTTGSRGVRISGSNAGYTMFRGSVKGTGYPLHSPVSPSLPLPCVTVCHHISTGLYYSLLFHGKDGYASAPLTLYVHCLSCLVSITLGFILHVVPFIVSLRAQDSLHPPAHNATGTVCTQSSCSAVLSVQSFCSLPLRAGCDRH